MKGSYAIAAVFGAAIAAVAFSGAASAASVEKVTLEEKDGKFVIEVSKATLPAGTVTFEVTNSPLSGSVHEMIVARLTPDEIAHPDKLPENADRTRVDEDKIKDLGEVSELEPGHSGTLTLALTPGTYILLCNVEGHYNAGMYTVVHVN